MSDLLEKTDEKVDLKGRTLCPECEDMMENVVGMNRPEGDRD